MKLASTTLLLIALIGSMVLTSCGTTGGSSRTTIPRTTSQRVNPNNPLYVQRNARIAQEPMGDYYIGRRFWIDGTRFWGFVRKPRQPWHEAKLVVMNETQKLTPDRIAEGSTGGPRHGFDHNYEYKIQGRFTGDEIYDPNSNQVLPEFLLVDYQVISARPGFLFHPDQTFERNRVPRPPSGLR